MHMTGQRLKAQSERLRSEFIRLDLNAARILLNLATFDLKQGETEHGNRLLTLAHQATDTVAKLAAKLGADKAPAVLEQVEMLRSGIAGLEHK
jgi:hypothetical protein